MVVGFLDQADIARSYVVADIASLAEKLHGSRALT